MSLPAINTVDPIALRYLMTDTVFNVDDGPVDVAPGAQTPSTEPTLPEPDKQVPSFTFFGGNKRNFLFLTHDKRHDWMSEADMNAFVKTLAALKLAEDDVALLNLSALASSPSVDQLTLFFKPKVVVNLGTPFAWPEQGDPKIFHTHAFAEMLVDAEKKRVFWTTIKRLLV